VAAVSSQTCSTSTRKVLVIGTVALAVAVMSAFILAIEQYFTIGEFFALRDVMHHEAVEMIFIAFGSGVFLAALGFALYHRSHMIEPTRYQIIVPPGYPFPVTYESVQLQRRDPYYFSEARET
jgi:hypothetical protein